MGEAENKPVIKKIETDTNQNRTFEQKTIQKPMAPKQEPQPKVDVSALINKCKQKAVNSGEALKKAGFPIGSRVFHSTYGIGFIKETKNVGDEISYKVDFLKHGIKEMDSKTSNLKAF